jgi:hypothetical protein
MLLHMPNSKVHGEECCNIHCTCRFVPMSSSVLNPQNVPSTLFSVGDSWDISASRIMSRRHSKRYKIAHLSSFLLGQSISLTGLKRRAMVENECHNPLVFLCVLDQDWCRFSFQRHDRAPWRILDAAWKRSTMILSKIWSLHSMMMLGDLEQIRFIIHLDSVSGRESASMLSPCVVSRIGWLQLPECWPHQPHERRWRFQLTMCPSPMMSSKFDWLSWLQPAPKVTDVLFQ